MPVSFKHLGRSVTLAALTASAVAVGGATANAAPAPTAAPVSVSTDMAAHSVTATLADGSFAANKAARSIDVVDARGATVESIPLTVAGTAAPIVASISRDGRSLTVQATPASAPVGHLPAGNGLVKAAGTDTFNTLIGQWMWGVEHGGGVGAVVGGLLGCLFIGSLGCLPGAVPGAAIGGTVASPNSGQINGTFMNLINGR
ncbi:hypothetical protein G4X40_02595 [Rhodococcus sp. D2-41]|uniref:DUF8020 domain-containing protein n=1 Tax=Speluncibacter jeojiensis TaxID=2710754 RepID=A0A9X4RHX2_9ACTN|nr:hypothetical protein [Rhodococcus sp. D2-41]MDG3009035.1 hypothetical protein [Rhodococcus sp. D2-41]MDG3015546.1 hypothetical protein [Corynebacteriales bacterium D3-21]